MKLYVLVRKDLTISQQAVQAGHAVAEFCRKFPNSEWGYSTLVYLGAEDKLELANWLDVFNLYGDEEVAEYREEYYNNELTAIAVLGSELVKTQVKELKLI